MVGTNDINKAGKFYDAVLIHLGLKRVASEEQIKGRYIGYRHLGNDLEIKFYVTKPQDKKDATAGNGSMIALSAQSVESVNKFHATALKNGATDEGSPGERSDGNYYGYIRDLDGNKLTARYVGDIKK